MERKTEVLDEVKNGKVVLTILAASGDDTVCCPVENKEQIDVLVTKFGDYMERGYVAFEVLHNGERGNMIDKKSWGSMTSTEQKTIFAEPKEIQLIPLIVGG